jgi:hypothetical protein
MKKSGLISFAIVLSLVLLLSFSFVSASWFSDFWGKLTGNAIYQNGNEYMLSYVIGVDGKYYHFIYFQDSLNTCNLGNIATYGNNLGYQCTVGSYDFSKYGQGILTGAFVYKDISSCNGVSYFDGKDLENIGLNWIATDKYLCLGNSRMRIYSFSSTCGTIYSAKLSENCASSGKYCSDNGNWGGECSYAYTYSWQTEAWSSCSVSCGAGTQTRSVLCLRNDGTVVSDSYCGAGKPLSSQSCNTQVCTKTRQIDYKDVSFNNCKLTGALGDWNNLNDRFYVGLNLPIGWIADYANRIRATYSGYGFEIDLGSYIEQNKVQAGTYNLDAAISTTNTIAGVISQGQIPITVSSATCSKVYSPISCTPNCAGKVCGDNGCGGNCGSCSAGQTCSNNICISGANPIGKLEKFENCIIYGYAGDANDLNQIYKTYFTFDAPYNPVAPNYIEAGLADKTYEGILAQAAGHGFIFNVASYANSTGINSKGNHTIYAYATNQAGENLITLENSGIQNSIVIGDEVCGDGIDNDCDGVGDNGCGVNESLIFGGYSIYDSSENPVEVYYGGNNQYFPNIILNNGNQFFHANYFVPGATCNGNSIDGYLDCGSFGYSCYSGDISLEAYGAGTVNGAICYKDCSACGCGAYSGKRINNSIFSELGQFCGGKEMMKSFQVSSTCGSFFIAKPKYSGENSQCEYNFPKQIVTDPEGDSETLAGRVIGDILESEIKQIDSNTIQFRMKLTDDVKASSRGLLLSYTWGLDFDSDSIDDAYITLWVNDGRDGSVTVYYPITNTNSEQIPAGYIGGNEIYVLVNKAILRNYNSFNYTFYVINNIMTNSFTTDYSSQSSYFAFDDSFNSDILSNGGIYNLVSDNHISDYPNAAYISLGGSIMVNYEPRDSCMNFKFNEGGNYLSLIDNRVYDGSGGDYSKFIYIDSMSLSSSFNQVCKVISKNIQTKKLYLPVGMVYNGNSNTMVMPGAFVPDNRVKSLNSVINEFKIMDVLDLNSKIQENLVGKKLPHNSILWIFSYPACGWAMSGDNIIALGSVCFENNLNQPLWGVYFHEAGHIFTISDIFRRQDNKFKGFASNDSGQGYLLYSEGFATLNGMYSHYKLLNDPIYKNNLNSPAKSSLEDSFTRGYTYFIEHRDAYSRGEVGDFKSCLELNNCSGHGWNADILDGIFLYYSPVNGVNSQDNLYGWEAWPRLYKIFSSPSVPEVKTQNRAHTFFVAALSAAVGTNQKERFKTQWHFPINDTEFDAVYPIFQNILDGSSSSLSSSVGEQYVSGIPIMIDTTEEEKCTSFGYIPGICSEDSNTGSASSSALDSSSNSEESLFGGIINWFKGLFD